MNPARDLPLLAAWRLSVPARALRSLARGDHAALRTWLAQESAFQLAEARPVISGLARGIDAAAHRGAAVVLVVSDAAGGAMHAMRFARELGRPRFALHVEASGNVQALEDGAQALGWNVDAVITLIDSVLACS